MEVLLRRLTIIAVIFLGLTTSLRTEITSGEASEQTTVYDTRYNFLNSTKYVHLGLFRCMEPEKLKKSKNWINALGMNMNYVYWVAGGAVVAPFAVPAVLSAAGFGAAGVTAGSAAAAIQSAVYGAGVSSGSIFAVCQSIGAAGLGTFGTVTSGAGGAAVAAAVKKWFTG